MDRARDHEHSAAARHPLVKAVAASLRGPCGVVRRSGGPDASVLVAVSGGAESTAMLRAMHLLSRRRGWRLRLVVGHVQHHLRPEAESEADFVASLAEHLHLPMVRRDIAPAAKGGNLEDAARRLRYAALADMAADMGDEAEAGFVAAAHHGDDQLETLLMRLIRGSGVRGLSGMAWRRRLAPGSDTRLIRPMLGVDRATVLDFLRTIDQRWCEDASNADGSRWRARLRRDVLPVLRDLRGDAAAKATAAADHLCEIRRMIAAQAAALPQEQLPRDMARTLAPPVLAAWLRRQLRAAGVAADRLGRAKLNAVLRAVRDNAGGVRRFAMGRNMAVRVTRSTIMVTRA
jgi:tRNA(Ile)-lysidine synthase